MSEGRPRAKRAIWPQFAKRTTTAGRIARCASEQRRGLAVLAVPWHRLLHPMRAMPLPARRDETPPPKLVVLSGWPTTSTSHLTVFRSRGSSGLPRVSKNLEPGAVSEDQGASCCGCCSPACAADIRPRQRRNQGSAATPQKHAPTPVTAPRGGSTRRRRRPARSSSALRRSSAPQTLRRRDGFARTASDAKSPRRRPYGCRWHGGDLVWPARLCASTSSWAKYGAHYS